jgi:hypothetical protein
MVVNEFNESIISNCLLLKGDIYSDKEYKDCVKNASNIGDNDNDNDFTNIQEDEDKNRVNTHNFYNNLEEELNVDIPNKDEKEALKNQYYKTKINLGKLNNRLIEEHELNENHQYTKLNEYYKKINRNSSILDKLDNNITKLDKIKLNEEEKLKNTSNTLLILVFVILFLICLVLLIVYIKF